VGREFRHKIYAAKVSCEMYVIKKGLGPCVWPAPSLVVGLLVLYGAEGRIEIGLEAETNRIRKQGEILVF